MLIFLRADGSPSPSLLASLALRTAQESEFVAISFRQPLIDAVVALYSPRLDPGIADLPAALPDGIASEKLLSALSHFCATKMPRFHFFRQLEAIELETPTPIIVYDLVWQDFVVLNEWAATPDHAPFEIINLTGEESTADLVNRIRIALG